MIFVEISGYGFLLDRLVAIDFNKGTLLLTDGNKLIFTPEQIGKLRKALKDAHGVTWIKV